MITIFVFIFIVTGNIFGAVLFQDEYREEVDYSVGGFTEITEAQTRGKLYLPRMEKEMNYSSNIIALDIKDEEDPAEWGESKGVSSKEQLRNNYENAVLEELRTQSKIRKCSNPQIGAIGLEDYTNYTADISDDLISCSDRSTAAEIKLERDSFWTNNSNNRYIKLSKEAVGLGEHLQEKDLPKNWEEGTGSASSSCQNSIDESLYTDEAKEEAKQDAIQDNNLAETVADPVDLEDWIGLDTSTTFEVSYTLENRDIDECDWIHSGHDVDCEENEDGEQVCDTHVHEDGGEEVNDITYSAEITEATLEYDLYDSERQVMDAEAEKRTIHFIFEYVYSMD